MSLPSDNSAFIKSVVRAACDLYGGATTPTRIDEIDSEALLAQARILALRMAAIAMAKRRNLLSGRRLELLAAVTRNSSTSDRTCEQLGELLGSAPGGADEPGLFSQSLIPSMHPWLRRPYHTLRAFKSVAEDENAGALAVTTLGRAYQALLDVDPTGNDFIINRQNRKSAGKYYTPPALVDYILRNTVGTLLAELASETAADDLPGRLLSIRVLDPSAGPGDFLLATSRFIGSTIARLTGSSIDQWIAAAAAQCVWGFDSDPYAVAVARTALWLESGTHSSNIKIGDSLRNAWTQDDGRPFDAVIGNPPYVARKNSDMDTYRELYDFQGQMDYYLMFLAGTLREGVVREGGYFSMVLPDPFIIRSNAVSMRRRFIQDWTMESLLHTRGMFPGAGVSNVVPVCRRLRSSSYTIEVTRAETSRELRAFAEVGSLKDAARHLISSQFVLSQPGAEILYLSGKHPTVPDGCHFERLGQMNVQIGRGEEVGKSFLSSDTGQFPALLGGQSIRPFMISWEGRRIDRMHIRKPLSGYLTNKILVQKSSGKLVAALDLTDDSHSGFVIPQSIYFIRSGSGGPDLLYLLAILNSSFLNDYVYRIFTGYKLVQPQIEIEDLRRLPIPPIHFQGDAVSRRRIVGRAWPPEDDSNHVLQRAEEWLCEGRTDLTHDLIVEIARNIVADKSAQPALVARQTLDGLVSLLYEKAGRQVVK